MIAAARMMVALALVFVFSGTGLGYTRPRWQIGPEIEQSRWIVAGPIPVLVNTDLPHTIVPGGQPFLAVRNMFERRSLHTPLLFDVQPTSAFDSIGGDGVSLVTFVNTPANQSASFSFAAVTWYWWQIIDDEVTLVESDIVFTNNFPHTTTGAGGIDIEGLGGHELIHFLSFDHSAVIASTAFPTFFTQVPNERNMAQDDLSAMAFLHPFAETPAITGSLSGTVMKPGGVPVFGAHVVAQHVPDGTPISDISVTGGQWRIDALPPGQYKVYVEPLDGPSLPSNTLFGGVYTSEVADQVIQTTFAGGNQTPVIFVVTAGAETSVGAIEVPTLGTTLNPRSLGLNGSPSPVITTTAVNVQQGWFRYLTIHGSGISSVPDAGVAISGSGITPSTTGIVRGTLQGSPYMVVPVSVAADAKPGLRTIFVDTGTRIAALTGGIEVHPSHLDPNLLRNDSLVAATGALVAAELPLDPMGPDQFQSIGEGPLRSSNGSQDDDDFYAPRIPSGFLDPDVAVLTDATRPLVLYQLDDASRTLYLGKTEFGRLEVTYVDIP